MSKRSKSKVRLSKLKNKIVYTLQSSKTITQGELDEIHLLDDMQDVRNVLDNGFPVDGLPFGDVPEVGS